MPRTSVVLDDEAFDRLSELARLERRTIRDQAGVLLEHVLTSASTIPRAIHNDRRAEVAHAR